MLLRQTMPQQPHHNYIYNIKDKVLKNESLFLQTLKRERKAVPPIWLMRQAGRYLPEYRQLRKNYPHFTDLVYDSAAATEITLQPLTRFDFDAAILFSDILVIPEALGQNLTFLENHGPRLTPALLEYDLYNLISKTENLAKIYETLRLLRNKLPTDKALIGFAGAPWTVATYMVNGQGSKDQSETRTYAYKHKAKFAEIISAITELTITYLKGQIDAGADCIQIFESWSGALSPQQYEEWVVRPNAYIVNRLREYAPTTPIIAFPKGAGGKLRYFYDQVKPDALALDETVDPYWADDILPKDAVVQGNLDPLALIAGGLVLEEAVARIKQAFQNRPYIFNLGHGILPHTPIKHVEYLLELVRS